MNRPTPRRSMLAGQTPAAPPEPTPATPPAPAAPSPSVVPSTSAPIATAPVARGGKQQLCAQVPVDLIARVRGVVLHTAPHGGPATIAAFMTQALTAYATALEAEFNDGAPFPAVPTGGIRTGRPPAS